MRPEQLEELCRQAATAAVAEFVRLQAQGDALPAPEWLSTAQCAALVGMTKDALANLRSRGSGPPYTKIGKTVRYPVDGVRAWLSKGLVKP